MWVVGHGEQHNTSTIKAEIDRLIDLKYTDTNNKTYTDSKANGTHSCTYKLPIKRYSLQKDLRSTAQSRNQKAAIFKARSSIISDKSK